MRASVSTLQFSQIMKLAGLSGRLKFHHEDKRLVLAMIRDGATLSERSKVTNVDELSDSERSYNRVALLLVLSSWTDSPFLIMSAFDGSLDCVNRVKMHDLLVKVVKRVSDKQFIFLTLDTDTYVTLIHPLAQV